MPPAPLRAPQNRYGHTSQSSHVDLFAPALLERMVEQVELQGLAGTPPEEAEGA
jgi:hypothetical protein